MYDSRTISRPRTSEIYRVKPQTSAVFFVVKVGLGLLCVKWAQGFRLTGRFPQRGCSGIFKLLSRIIEMNQLLPAACFFFFR